MFTSLLDKIGVFKIKSTSKSDFGDFVNSFSTLSTHDVRLVEKRPSVKYSGNKMYEDTTHFVFSDFFTFDIYGGTYLIEIESKNYQILGVERSSKEHHLKFMVKLYKGGV
jgi:hypothetical protein